MKKYKFSGQIVESAFPISAASYRGIKKSSVRILDAKFKTEKINWYHNIKTNGAVIYRFGSKGKIFYLKIGKFGICKINKNEISIQMLNDVTEENKLSVIIYGILPLYFSLQNFLVLHASCIATDKGAILFVGEKGMGKSTLAALFSQKGFKVLSDDFILLESINKKFYVHPNLSEVRLFKNSVAKVFGKNNKLKMYSSYNKKRIDLAQKQSNYAIPLKEIFFLKKEGRKFSITKTRNCFQELIQNMYRLDLISKQKIHSEFKMICDLSAQVTTSYLDYPRRYDASASVIKNILVS